MSRRRVRQVLVAATATTQVVVISGAIIALAVQEPVERPVAPRAAVPEAPPAAPVVPATLEMKPLKQRHSADLLLVASDTVAQESVAKIRKAKGIKAVEIVDAGRLRVGETRVGTLGVDPATFRAFTPEPTAKSDVLWQNVAGGEVALAFETAKQLGGETGQEVTVGNGAGIRVGAHAEVGIANIGAVVSHEQARKVGLPAGNALVISAPKVKDPKKRLGKLIPKGAQLSQLSGVAYQRKNKNTPQVTRKARSRLTGNRMTPTMARVVSEIDATFGPFSTIGCFRPGDPQDHGTGRACDFMVSPLGSALTPQVRKRGDRIVSYAVTHARRLRIKYVIWRQYIWNIRRPGWRLMENRGSNTQNHMDHPHISVL